MLVPKKLNISSEITFFLTFYITYLDGCPEGDGYVFILETCYYIEKELMNYFDAKLNCKNLGGNNNNGTHILFRKINILGKSHF